MSKGCGSCKFVQGDEFKCSKGEKAEIYCMGGDFELWEPSEQFFEAEKKAERISNASSILGEDFDIMDGELSEHAENIGTFQSPEVPYGNDLMEVIQMSIEDVEKKVGRPLSDSEKEEFLNQQRYAAETLDKLRKGEIGEDVLVQSMTTEQQQVFNAMKQAMGDIAARPKSEEEGFNGVKKVSVTGKISCAGCKNHSMVGCFLGKYYDCVDNGRYLFDPENVEGVPSLEHEKEKIDDQKDINFVDNMMDNIDRQKQ